MSTRPESPALLAQRQRLRELLDAAGLSARRDEVERLCAPGLGMRTRDATARDLSVGATRLGGDPDLPRGAPWPVGSEEPLLFVLQVDLAAVSPFDLEGVLPGDGLLLLFVDRWGREAHVAHAPPGTTLEPVAAHGHAARRFTPCGLDLFAELHLAPPLSATFEDATGAWTDDECDAYWDALWLPWRDAQRPGAAGTCGVHQMLGHPTPESDGSIARGDVVLFGVDSDDRAAMEWGDVHALWVTLAPADLAARAWSRARVAM